MPDGTRLFAREVLRARKESPIFKAANENTDKDKDENKNN